MIVKRYWTPFVRPATVADAEETDWVHLTAQCAYPVTDVSHAQCDAVAALHAIWPFNAVQIDQSPASPQVLTAVREIRQWAEVSSLALKDGDTTMAVPATLVTV